MGETVWELKIGLEEHEMTAALNFRGAGVWADGAGDFEYFSKNVAGFDVNCNKVFFLHKICR